MQTLVFHSNDTLDEETYLIYAAQHYQNAQCLSLQEFKTDIKGLVYARTLMRKYAGGDDLNIRLLLNHVIILTNVFGNQPTVRLFFFKCEKDLYPILKAIFTFLNILPDWIPEVKDLSAITIDLNMLKALEKL